MLTLNYRHFSPAACPKIFFETNPEVIFALFSVILGNFGSRIGMNPRTRLLVSEFWDFLAFFVNSIVFLLIGDQIDFASLTDNFDLIIVAIASVLVTRAIVIFGLGNISNLISQTKTNLREQTVLWWGGSGVRFRSL